MAKKMSFDELQSYWYSRLNTNGFVDIEDTSRPDRPLKQWHSFKFISCDHHIEKMSLEEYQLKLMKLIEHESFDDLCILIASSRKSKLNADDIKIIATLHLEGLSVREIAIKFKKSKSRIQLNIERIRQWMNLI